MNGRIFMANKKYSDSQPAPTLPHPEICRARELTERFAQCLVPHPMGCQFAMSWGYEYLCGHPNHANIVASTKQGDAKQGE